MQITPDILHKLLYAATLAGAAGALLLIMVAMVVERAALALVNVLQRCKRIAAARNRAASRLAEGSDGSQAWCSPVGYGATPHVHAITRNRPSVIDSDVPSAPGQPC